MNRGILTYEICVILGFKYDLNYLHINKNILMHVLF